MAIMRMPLERRFSDLDLMGHVNNVAYHDYFQEARFRLLAELGRETVEALPQVVARQEIDYVRPIGIGLEPLIVETWVESVGRSSYVVAYLILDSDGSLAAKARTVMVLFDEATTRSRLIPDDVRSWLESAMAEEGTDGDSRNNRLPGEAEL